jgi:hypothetical protein
MNEPTAFWLNDLKHPDSRFADVLHANAGAFDGIWGDIAPVSFACEVWRLATPPVSVPGFVRWHRRVLTVRCERNTYDGSLTARVEVASPLPAALSTSKTCGGTTAGGSGRRSSGSSCSRPRPT